MRQNLIRTALAIIFVCFLVLNVFSQKKSLSPKLENLKKDIIGNWSHKSDSMVALQLKFFSKNVMEKIGNDSSTYQYIIVDSLKYGEDILKSKSGEWMLAFLRGGDVVYFYYITALSKKYLTLLSGFNLQSIVYKREKF